MKGSQYSLFETAEALPVQSATPIASSSATEEPTFSDFVVYVDESGDHSLASIDPGYPVFVLAFCIFHKRHYSEAIIPAIEKLKFNYFGHDSVVLHETDIRKQRGDFAILSHKPRYDDFMAKLSAIVEQAKFVLIACVVEKARLSRQSGEDSNPYHVALDHCLQGLYDFLSEKGQEKRQTHVIVECRGKKEDRELELEFRRICDGQGMRTQTLPFQVVFADKKTNLAGLQLADLVARPVGIASIRPHQPNQAFDILKAKFYCEGGRAKAGEGYESYGLVIHPPRKAKGPGEPTEAIAPTGNPQST